MQSDGENGTNSVPRVSCIQSQVKAASLPPRELSPANSTAAWVGKSVPPAPATTSLPPLDSKTWKIMLPHAATAETTAGWLAYNRCV